MRRSSRTRERHVVADAAVAAYNGGPDRDDRARVIPLIPLHRRTCGGGQSDEVPCSGSRFTREPASAHRFDDRQNRVYDAEWRGVWPPISRVEDSIIRPVPWSAAGDNTGQLRWVSGLFSKRQPTIPFMNSIGVPRRGRQSRIRNGGVIELRGYSKGRGCRPAPGFRRVRRYRREFPYLARMSPMPKASAATAALRRGHARGRGTRRRRSSRDHGTSVSFLPEGIRGYLLRATRRGDQIDMWPE